MSAFSRIRQNGLIAIAIREGDELISVLRTHGDDRVIIGSRDGMAIAFHEGDVRPMGRVAVGVRGIKLREGDEVIGASRLEEDQYVAVISENGYGKRTAAEEYREQTRGGIGARTMNITEKTGKLVSLLAVHSHEDIMLINDSNVIIRMNSDEISVFGRSAQGVRLMRMEQGGRVVGAAKLPPMEEDDAAGEDAEE